MSTIIVFDVDGPRRSTLTAALERRFGADYEVLASAWSDATEGLPAGSGPVAVALAPVGAPDFAALRAVGAAHSTARRIAVVEVGDTSVAAELGQAMTLGHVDYYVGHPWASPEEELYPVVSEALRVWSHDQQLRLPKLTLVRERGDEHGNHLATMLERNGIPARVHAPDEPEAQALLDGPLAGQALPALHLWDGRVIAAPSRSEMAEALGARTRPTRDHYDLAIVGTGPAGLAAATYAASEGLRAVAIEGFAVGGQAGTSAGSATTSGSPGASAAPTSPPRPAGRRSSSGPRSS